MTRSSRLAVRTPAPPPATPYLCTKCFSWGAMALCALGDHWTGRGEYQTSKDEMGKGTAIYILKVTIRSRAQEALTAASLSTLACRSPRRIGSARTRGPRMFCGDARLVRAHGQRPTGQRMEGLDRQACGDQPPLRNLGSWAKHLYHEADMSSQCGAPLRSAGDPHMAFQSTGMTADGLGWLSTSA